jgi:hypothetical protein
MLLPPPPPLSSLALALPSNDNSSTMATRRGAPPPFNSGTGSERWPAGFAYNLNVTLPLSLSYADVAANRLQGLRWNALPL